MKRIALALVSYSDEERRATMVGVNLFFGALLGANLGVTEKLTLEQYVALVIALAGMVTAMFTITVSRRPIVIWSTAATIGVILALILSRVDDYWPAVVVPDVYRILATLLIWLAFIVSVKVAPSAKDHPGAPPRPELMTED